MAVGALPALGLGIGTFGAATNAFGAASQNRAIRSSMESQRRVTADTQRQIAQRTGLEQMRTQRMLRKMQGRIRVAAGERGVGMGGSIAAMQQQAAFDAATDQAVIRQNFDNQIAQVQSGFRSSMSQLSSRTTSPILAGITGGLGTLSTGLSIAGAFEDQFEERSVAKQLREMNQ